MSGIADIFPLMFLWALSTTLLSFNVQISCIMQPSAQMSSFSVNSSVLLNSGAE